MMMALTINRRRGYEKASIVDDYDRRTIRHRPFGPIGRPQAEKEFSPSGRLSDGSIKGTLVRTEGEYYFIKGPDGIENKIHVDKSTKSEKVQPGDMVRAYVTDEGHTTALTVVKRGN